MGEIGAQKRGGIIRVGMQGEPPALDPHWTTAVNTEVIGGHIFEGLYTLGDTNQPVPDAGRGPHGESGWADVHLQASPGCKFHNGKELTSDDVVASLDRWGKQSIYGKDLFGQVASLRAVDRHTVELKLKERSAIVLMNLSLTNSFAAIYPKEIVEKFPPSVKVTEFVGTGPYRFVEWKPDQYVRVVRYDGYRPRNERPNGYGGARRRTPTRFAGSRCPTWRPGSPRSRPASWTTRTT